jgi:RNA polymerase sigma factor (sigma-70 family)
MRGNQNRDSRTWLATRRSMVERLKNWDDQETWRELFDRYWQLIYSVACKAGLTESEAEEVVQKTVLSVAKKMDSFTYDPAVCSFKGWLKHVTQLRILDQFRKRGPREFQPARPKPATVGTATLERIPDPAPFPLEAVWDKEWEQNLVEAAMERVKRQVSPTHYQIYYLHVIKGRSARQVASMLGVATAQVYLITPRCGGLGRAVTGTSGWRATWWELIGP